VVTMGAVPPASRAHLSDLQSSATFAPSRLAASPSTRRSPFDSSSTAGYALARGSVVALVVQSKSGRRPQSGAPGVIEPLSTRPRSRNTLFPFVGGGKDRAAWSAVRAATRPDAAGGRTGSSWRLQWPRRVPCGIQHKARDPRRA
jgi:hypothetical protein